MRDLSRYFDKNWRFKGGTIPLAERVSRAEQGASTVELGRWHVGTVIAVLFSTRERHYLDDTYYRGSEPLPEFVWRNALRLILENRSVFTTEPMHLVVRPKLFNGTEVGQDVQIDVPELKQHQSAGMTFYDPAVSQIELVDWWLARSPEIRSMPVHQS